MKSLRKSINFQNMGKGQLTLEITNQNSSNIDKYIFKTDKENLLKTKAIIVIFNTLLSFLTLQVSKKSDDNY